MERCEKIGEKIDKASVWRGRKDDGRKERERKTERREKRKREKS